MVIAHRGSSARAPESTEVAIRLAIRDGSDMIELDVQMTQDSRLIIFHDERLDRTTNGRGRLSAWPYSRIRRLDAGGWFSSRFRGERILLASQALQLIPAPVEANLELKPPSRNRASDMTRRMVTCVRRGRAWRRTLISSFDASLIARVRAAAPSLATALLCRARPAASLRRAAALGCVAWHPHASLVTPSLVRAAHQRKLRVHVWTVDRLREARRLLRAGVDGVFTNRPERIRPLCAKRRRSTPSEVPEPRGFRPRWTA